MLSVACDKPYRRHGILRTDPYLTGIHSISTSSFSTLFFFLQNLAFFFFFFSDNIMLVGYNAFERFSGEDYIHINCFLWGCLTSIEIVPFPQEKFPYLNKGYLSSPFGCRKACLVSLLDLPEFMLWAEKLCVLLIVNVFGDLSEFSDPV